MNTNVRAADAVSSSWFIPLTKKKRSPARNAGNRRSASRSAAPVFSAIQATAAVGPVHLRDFREPAENTGAVGSLKLIEAISKIGFWFKIKAGPSFPA
jgi:hypothetical protein